jgi:hypothetical protein
MERKVGAGTAAVSQEALRTALGKTSSLTAEEEKAVRMRHGLGAATGAEPLPRAATGNADLEDELLVIEMRLLRAIRLRNAHHEATRNVVAAPSRTKDKIVRSLRRKK